MAEEQVFLTESGFKLLEEKLKNLKEVRRKDIAEKLKIAREFGDLSENAEYDAAKEEQAQIEGEILEIEKKLRKATIISDENNDKTSVGMGTKVKVKNENTGKTCEYIIVGTSEVDIVNGKISNESPVGVALMGAKINDIVEAHTPKGDVNFKVLEIK